MLDFIVISILFILWHSICKNIDYLQSDMNRVQNWWDNSKLFVVFRFATFLTLFAAMLLAAIGCPAFIRAADDLPGFLQTFFYR